MRNYPAASWVMTPGVNFMLPFDSLECVPHTIPAVLVRKEHRPAGASAIQCRTSNRSVLIFPAAVMEWRATTVADAGRLLRKYKMGNEISEMLFVSIDTAVQQVCARHSEVDILVNPFILKEFLNALNAELKFNGVTAVSFRWFSGVSQPADEAARAHYNSHYRLTDQYAEEKDADTARKRQLVPSLVHSPYYPDTSCSAGGNCTMA